MTDQRRQVAQNVNLERNQQTGQLRVNNIEITEVILNENSRNPERRRRNRPSNLEIREVGQEVHLNFNNFSSINNNDAVMGSGGGNSRRQIQGSPSPNDNRSFVNRSPNNDTSLSPAPRRHRIRRNNHDRENENSDDHIEIELTDSDIHDIYLSFFISILVVHIFALMVIAYYFDMISLFPIFIFLGIADFFDLVKLIHKVRHLTQPSFKKRYILITVEKIIMIGFKLMLLYSLVFPDMFVVYSSIPIAFYTVIRCIIYSIDKKTSDCYSIIDFLLVAYRIFAFVQHLTLSLRIDNFIDWDWKEIFWCYWVFFSILIGVNFGQFLMISSRICQGLFGQIDCVEFKGMFWFYILSGSITFGSCFLILGIIDVMDTKDFAKLNFTLYFLMITASLTIMTSVLLKSDILKFLKSISSVEEEEGVEKKTSKDEPGSPESIVIPKFLQRFSSTYFKKATLPGGISPSKLLDKEKSPKQAKKKTKIVKKHMTHHKRSSSATNLRDVSISQTGENIASLINNHQFLPLINNNNRTTDQTNMTEQKDNNLMSINPTNMYSHYEDEDSFKKTPEIIKGKQDLDTIIQFDTEENNMMSQLNPNANSQANQKNKVLANKEYLKDLLKETKVNNTKKNHVPSKTLAHNPYKSPSNNEPNVDQGLHILSSENDENDKREKKKFNKNQMDYFSVLPNLYDGKGDMNEARLRHNRFHSAVNLKKNHSFSNDLLDSSVEETPVESNTKRGPNDSPGQNNLERSVANCLICFDKPPDAVFMECGHGGVCYECSLELWKSTEECYLCREKIKQVLQIDAKNRNGSYIKVVSATHMVKEGRVKKN